MTDEEKKDRLQKLEKAREDIDSITRNISNLQERHNWNDNSKQLFMDIVIRLRMLREDCYIAERWLY